MILEYLLEIIQIVLQAKMRRQIVGRLAVRLNSGRGKIKMEIGTGVNLIAKNHFLTAIFLVVIVL